MPRNRIALLLLVSASASACGCQNASRLRDALPDMPGQMMEQTVTNAHDLQRYPNADPMARLERESRPGASMESWQNAQRDYPDALPTK